MIALWTAIYTKYTGSALATALTGGLHFDNAPAGTTTPFGVYYDFGGPSEWTFTSDEEIVNIQFNIYHKSDDATTIGNIKTTLRTLFDDCILPVTGYTMIWMRRPENVDSGEVSQDIETGYWQYVEKYEVYLQKN